MELQQHQKDGSTFIATNPRGCGILAHITGSGKSITTITGMIKSYALQKIPKHIIVATVSSYPEICNDMETEFKHKLFEIQSTADFEEFMISDKVFGITKYGILKRIDPFLISEYTSTRGTSMYFDEAHQLKNSATIIQKHLQVYRKYLKGLYLITATPIMSSAEDLQGLFWLLAPKLLGSVEQFYKTFSNYRMVCYIKKGEVRNCRCGGKLIYNGSIFECKRCGNSYPPKKQIEPISYKNQELLAKLTAPFIHSFFPPRDLRYFNINTTLDELGSHEYNTIAKAIMSNGEEQHSARMIKLQHYLNESEAKKTILKELVKILKVHGVIIYASYHKTVEVIEDILKTHKDIEYKSITGKLNSKSRKQVRDWFREGAKNKVLIITDAGGASLNLQATNNLIFYDIPFSVGNFIQVVGRVARYFSAFKHYNIFFPIVKGTLDEYKFNYISAKKDLIDQVLQNKCLPQGLLDSYNADELRDLRSKTLWNRED